MTCCIAAICQNGQSVIIAADRMLSTPMIEFEHPSTRKVTEFSPRCHALTAGDALAHTELFTMVERQIAPLRDPSVEQIVSTIEQAYQEIRQKQIEQRFLKPRGINSLEEYYRKQQFLNDSIVFRVLSEVESYNYELDILVGGISPNRAHIYSVTNPGVSQCYDSINFHAIGNGAFHVFNCMTGRNYHQSLSLPEALMTVFDGKRVAQVAPGVGEVTDISIIIPDGTIEISPERVEDLLTINDHWRQGNNAWQSELTSFIRSLATTPHPDNGPEQEGPDSGVDESGEIREDGSEGGN